MIAAQSLNQGIKGTNPALLAENKKGHPGLGDVCNAAHLRQFIDEVIPAKAGIHYEKSENHGFPPSRE
ncbi:MAG: hypothetical protein ACPF9K_14660 [Neptuniibacter sp.]